MTVQSYCPVNQYGLSNYWIIIIIIIVVVIIIIIIIIIILGTGQNTF